MPRAAQVVHPGGDVIKPEMWKCVNDEGMPVHGRPYEKGNLYIRFAVKFPDALDAGTVKALRSLLPAGDPPVANGKAMETEDVEQARCRPTPLPYPTLHRAGALPAPVVGPAARGAAARPGTGWRPGKEWRAGKDGVCCSSRSWVLCALHGLQGRDNTASGCGDLQRAADAG